MHPLGLINDTDSFLASNNSNVTHILLIGKAFLDISANSLLIFNVVKNYVMSTNRFKENLF